MQLARRFFAFALVTSGCAWLSQSQDVTPELPDKENQQRHESDDRLPNGKSRSNAIAQSEHKKALEEADQLIEMAQDLKKQIDKAGMYVVPMTAVRTTEEIEKLARKIRGRLRM
jgi:mitochondrial fission protein ELM1